MEAASQTWTQRILIVDDNEMNRDVLSRRLERQGFAVGIAEDGVQALERARDEHFDLILLDIMMPRLNGYQVLEALKADDVLRHVPVIVISAVDELDSVVRCIELGAEDYLFKPFNPVLLKARVAASLARPNALRLRQELQTAYEALSEVWAATPTAAAQTAIEALYRAIAVLQGVSEADGEG